MASGKIMAEAVVEPDIEVGLLGMTVQIVDPSGNGSANHCMVHMIRPGGNSDAPDVIMTLAETLALGQATSALVGDITTAMEAMKENADVTEGVPVVL